MEREVWVRAGMFATIIVLVALILETPSLLGHPSELSSVPILIVAMTENRTEFVIDVTAAVQPYLYDNVTLDVKHISPDNSTANLSYFESSPAYNAALHVPASASPLRIHTKLVDHQGNFFESNVTVQVFLDPDNGLRLTMLFNFPDVKGAAAVYRVPPSDFRWAIPRSGVIR